MKSLKESLINKDLIKRNKSNNRPKTKEELQEIIYDTMEKEGPDCDLNFIDTSLITDMSYLLPEEFCGNVSYWDVRKVENMYCMFSDCKEFNCDLSQWDVSKVKDMYGMFERCEKFEGKGLEKWDVSNVEDMNSMFMYCKKFKCKGLEKWDVSNVKDKTGMFYGCDNLKKQLPSWYK